MNPVETLANEHGGDTFEHSHKLVVDMGSILTHLRWQCSHACSGASLKAVGGDASEPAPRLIELPRANP